MANFLKDFLGGKSSAAPSPTALDDFADYVSDAASPAVQSFAGATSSLSSVAAKSTAAASNLFGAPTHVVRGPYTRWYRIWERHSWKDFIQEYIVVTFIFVVVSLHLWGTSKNRRIAKKWLATLSLVLAEEYSVVGFGRGKRNVEELLAGEGLPPLLMKEKSANEFVTYATGRQNVAFVDVELVTLKRYNPALLFAEATTAIFFESFQFPKEVVIYSIFPFDGREKDLLPNAEELKMGDSTYNDFVFAVVRKDIMARLRDERYDLSLAPVRDHARLPEWLAVMTENAEIADTLLTPELVSAVEKAGVLFDYLIVSDQPMDKPTKLEETVSKKRVYLQVSLTEDPAVLPIQTYAVSGFMDTLVSKARFRPEVVRKLKAVREEEASKLKRAAAEESREELAIKKEKEKKEKREAMLRGMSADEQRKLLEKERERDLRKRTSKMKARG